MYRSGQLLFLVATVLAGHGAICTLKPAEAAPLDAGFAHGDVTPKVTEKKPVGLQYPAVLKIRSRLTGFDYVLVASTHNHEGPDVIGIWGPSPFRSGVDPKYVEFVVDRVVQTIRQAAERTAPVHAAYGTATDETLLRDSRLPTAYDGVMRIVHFTAAGSDKTAGLLVQWSCHPESLGSRNRLITADFPFATVAALQKHYACPVVYFTGAVGGLMSNPPTIRTPDGKELHDETFEFAEAYGRAVARLAQKAADAAEPVSLSPMVVSARPVMIPLANPLYQAGRLLGVLTREALVYSDDFEKLGPPATAATPAEKLAVKTEVACLLPGKRVLLLGMANDEVGYIIPKRQWDHKPPFAYGRKQSQYGEINSCGPATAPVLMEALRRRVRELQALDRPSR